MIDEELDKHTQVTLPAEAEDISIHALEYHWPRVTQQPEPHYIGQAPEVVCAHCGKQISFYRDEVYKIGQEGRRIDGAPVYVCGEHAPETSLTRYQIWGVGDPQDLWDEGYGPLWAMWVSFGNGSCIDGFIRCETMDEAYDCWRDEIAADGDEDVPITDECGDAWDEFVAGKLGDGHTNLQYAKLAQEQRDAYDCWCESNGYRDSGEPSNPRLGSHIYAKDTNTSGYPSPVTPRMLAEAYTWGMAIRFRLPAEEEGELSYPVEMRFTTLDWVANPEGGKS